MIDLTTKIYNKNDYPSTPPEMDMIDIFGPLTEKRCKISTRDEVFESLRLGRLPFLIDPYEGTNSWKFFIGMECGWRISTHSGWRL